MRSSVAIEIYADVPTGQEEAAHEAIVATRQYAEAILSILKELGLGDPRARRRILRRKDGAEAPGAEVPVVAKPDAVVVAGPELVEVTRAMNGTATVRTVPWDVTNS